MSVTVIHEYINTGDTGHGRYDGYSVGDDRYLTHTFGILEYQFIVENLREYHGFIYEMTRINWIF
jgi:hypothetical protein